MRRRSVVEDPTAFLDAVEAVMRAFGADGVIDWDLAKGAEGLRSVGVVTTAAVIRWAANETGRSEEDLLAEVRRTLAE